MVIGNRIKHRVFCFISIFLFLVQSDALGGDGRAARAALVIIDMQNSFVAGKGYDQIAANQQILKKMIQVELQAIHAAKAAGIPIIFMEYQGQGGTLPVLLNATSGYKNVAVISKGTDGMFDEDNVNLNELKDFLKKNRVHDLILTGVNGESCVLNSIKGALQRHYRVFALENGIADFSSKVFIYPYVHRYSQFNSEPDFHEIDDPKTLLSEKPLPELNSVLKAHQQMLKLEKEKK
jgi:nicotinamidase-related amidase